MKKHYRAYWKDEVIISIGENEDLEDAIHEELMSITTNPYDYIDFEEVEE